MLKELAVTMQHDLHSKQNEKKLNHHTRIGKAAFSRCKPRSLPLAAEISRKCSQIYLKSSHGQFHVLFFFFHGGRLRNSKTFRRLAN